MTITTWREAVEAESERRGLREHVEGYAVQDRDLWAAYWAALEGGARLEADRVHARIAALDGLAEAAFDRMAQLADALDAFAVRESA
jgi:hypothetical protein